MGIIFKKSIQEFNQFPRYQLYNKRINLPALRMLKRIDLTFQSKDPFYKASHPYVDNLQDVKHLLPIPNFLLKPLSNYVLPFTASNSLSPQFEGNKTVIYLHGADGFAEENSILHRCLLENGCNLIKISYTIDYKKENITLPEKEVNILPFLYDLEAKITPIATEELNFALSHLIKDYPDLFENKEVILMAHSLGGGLLANLACQNNTVKFSRLIDFGGILMIPAINQGLTIPQLHFSWYSLFDAKDKEKTTAVSTDQRIAMDYRERIKSLIKNSAGNIIWIYLKDAAYFTFTDFPYFLNSSSIFKTLVGSKDTAKRIRDYVVEFILNSDIQNIDPSDNLIYHHNIIT